MSPFECFTSGTQSPRLQGPFGKSKPGTVDFAFGLASPCFDPFSFSSFDLPFPLPSPFRGWNLWLAAGFGNPLDSSPLPLLGSSFRTFGSATAPLGFGCCFAFGCFAALMGSSLWYSRASRRAVFNLFINQSQDLTRYAFLEPPSVVSLRWFEHPHFFQFFLLSGHLQLKHARQQCKQRAVFSQREFVSQASDGWARQLRSHTITGCQWMSKYLKRGHTTEGQENGATQSVVEVQNRGLQWARQCTCNMQERSKMSLHRSHGWNWD